MNVPSWWPDWSGETAAILASGPSLTEEQCDEVRGRARAIAINTTWRRAPWADALYACDWRWWGWSAPAGAEFRGLRVIGFEPPEMGLMLAAEAAPRADHCAGLRCAGVTPGLNRMRWDGAGIGSGGSGAFQAVNLAAMWGARRIILLGVDCRAPGSRWHGAHPHPRQPNPTEQTMRLWLDAWRAAAPDLSARGVEVINCAPGSALDAFPAADLGRALNGGR